MTGHRSARGAWLICAIGLVLIAGACCCLTGPSGTDGTGGAVRGFGLSPRGFPLDYGQIGDFFAEVGAMDRGGVLWNGCWRDDKVGGADAGEIPGAATGIEEAATIYGFFPMVVFGWRSGTTLYISVPGNPANDWSNQAARELFEEMLQDFASQYAPPVVFLGNENDFYFEQDAQDYANWISFYDDAYDAIKAVSPRTLVGPVFNLEHMAGTGALNGWTASHWGALDAHDLTKVDIVGITLYPWFGFETPDMVPGGHMDGLFERIGSTPVAITETGWPAEDLGGLDPSWETSAAAQVEYVSRLESMLSGREINMVNWLFLHMMVDPGDTPDEWKLFASVSVRDSLGDKRPVYDPWKSFHP